MLGAVSLIEGVTFSSAIFITVALSVSVGFISYVGCVVVGSVAVTVGSTVRFLLSVETGSFSFSVSSTAVTGGVVFIGVSVIIVSDTVVDGLSVGGGAVLPPHPSMTCFRDTP